MVNFADHLHRFGDRDAIITAGGDSISYAELANRADAFAASIGSTRRLLIVETLNELSPLVAYVGALRGRHPVILAADGSTANDGRTAEIFAPHAVFRRRGDGWGLDTLDGHGGLLLHEDLAVLLSTSGSTGSPKLVRLSHENIGSNADAIADYLGLDSSSRPITALPFHYSYGMSVINSHLAAGATLLLTNESVISPKFWEFFRAQRATSLAGVPYTFDLLDRVGFRTQDLPSLKQITQAGGRLAPEKVRDYAQWARGRGVQFYVMYGQTEASPRMAYLPPERVIEDSDCIGVPIPGGAFKIVDNDGTEINRPGVTGELVYYGPNVMMGYASGREDLARPPGISELRTGDLACRTQGGLYRIVGRKSRFSKLFGLRLSFDEIEAFLAQRAIVSAITGDDEKIVVCVEKEDPQQDIVELVSKKYSIGPSAIVTVKVEDFPRLTTGKIDYRAILNKAASLRPEPSEQGVGKGATIDLRESYGRALGQPDILPDDTFVGLGGDSLSYVEVSLAIERDLGYLPDGWEDMPVSQIEGLKVRAPSGTSLPTDIVIRFTAIMTIIFEHASELPLVGGANALLIIAGYSLARFQGPKLLAGSPWPVILRYLVNFVLIYYAVALIYVPVFDGGLNLKKLWWIVSVDYMPGALFYLWFIQVLFQSVVFFSVPFVIPAYRNLFKRFPWASGCVLLIAAYALHFVSQKVNIRGLYTNDTPDGFYLPVLGWCLYFTQTRWQKMFIAGFVALVVATIFFPRPQAVQEGIWLLCAMPLMIWTKRIPVPASFLVPISTVATASFFIYLMQGLTLREIGLMGGHWWRIPDITVQSLSLGLALWASVRWATRMRAKLGVLKLNWNWPRHRQS